MKSNYLCSYISSANYFVEYVPDNFAKVDSLTMFYIGNISITRRAIRARRGIVPKIRS